MMGRTTNIGLTAYGLSTMGEMYKLANSMKSLTGFPSDQSEIADSLSTSFYIDGFLRTAWKNVGIIDVITSPAELRIWGMSPAQNPGNHTQYLELSAPLGCKGDSWIFNTPGIIAPYASFLALDVAPQEAMRHKDVKIKLAEWEEEIASFPKLVAIGEIGLDYHWAKSEEEKYLQQEAFVSQLVLAERLSLPVVIHSRDAEEKCLEILRGFNLNFLLHCYSGTPEAGLEAMGGKGMVSIPPIHNKERKRLIRDASLEKLVAETDAPYIGKTPADAIESIKMIAEIKGMDEKLAASQTLANTISFFKIG